MKILTLITIEKDASTSDMTYEEYSTMLWLGLFKLKNNKSQTRQLAKELACSNKWYEIYYHLHNFLFEHITEQNSL